MVKFKKKFDPNRLFRRPCIRCDNMFRPTGRRQRVCINCNKIANKTALKNKGMKIVTLTKLIELYKSI